MNLATLAFFIIALVFAWRGYSKGLFISVAGVLAWAAAYGAAIFQTRTLAAWLVEHTSLDGLAVYMVAGGLIFLTVSAALNLVIKLIARLRPEGEESRGSKIGGAGVGIVIGGVVGLIAVYGISLVRDPSVRITPGVWTPVTERGLYDGTSLDYFLESTSKAALGNAAATAVSVALDDDAAAGLTKAFVENPTDMVGHAQQVMQNNEHVTALMQDEEFQSHLYAGNVQAVMDSPDFQALMDDEHMRALMAQTGASHEANKQEVAETMVSVLGRANELSNNPRVLTILNDPEFIAKLNAQDRMALIMDPRLKELTEIMFSGASAPRRSASAE